MYPIFAFDRVTKKKEKKRGKKRERKDALQRKYIYFVCLADISLYRKGGRALPLILLDRTQRPFVQFALTFTESGIHSSIFEYSI